MTAIKCDTQINTPWLPPSQNRMGASNVEMIGEMSAFSRRIACGRPLILRGRASRGDG